MQVWEEKQLKWTAGLIFMESIYTKIRTYLNWTFSIDIGDETMSKDDIGK